VDFHISGFLTLVEWCRHGEEFSVYRRKTN
jgi:hypothetical protein